MKRQYILCEQMDYIETFIVPRLESVIGGEQGGISKLVNWNGGGSFVYCELAKANQKYVDEIQLASTTDELLSIYDKIIATGFISSRVSVKDINDSVDEYKELSIDDQKRFLMELLDKNLLYVNFCDIDDEEFHISEESKQYTRTFYEGV